MSAERCKAALEAASDSIELPFAVVAVELAYHHCGFNGEILAQIEAHQLLIGGLINYAAVGLGYLAEILLSLVGIVNGNGKGNLGDVFRHLGEFNVNLLVIAFAVAGAVIAAMHHGAALVLEVAVENEVGIGSALAAGVCQKHRGIKVKINAGIESIHIPAQSYLNLAETGVVLGQADLLSF